MAKPNKTRTKAQIIRHEKIIELGCAVRRLRRKTPCKGRNTIQHAQTKMGGGESHGRNHDKVYCLCYEHHLGAEGIDGKRMGRRVWEAKYATEEYFMALTARLLGEST
jgi:hypothetical protein